MLLAILLVVFSVVLFIIFQAVVMPLLLKTDGERTRRQVQEMTSHLQTQLERVEAQQRSVVEDIVMIKSYAADPVAAWEGVPYTDAGQEHALFSALMKALGQRVGGRFWLVDESGQVVAEPAGVSGSKLLSELDLPMAVPLKSLLEGVAKGCRHTTFRTASGEHLLVVQPVTDKPLLLAMDIPLRCLNENTGKIICQPWPLATVTLVCTLKLLRSLLQHLPVMHRALPGLVLEGGADSRAAGAGVPAIFRDISEQVLVIADAALLTGLLNEQLQKAPVRDANLTAMLADSSMDVVRAVSELYGAARRIAGACGALVPLCSKAYTCSLYSKDDTFAHEARELAQRCAQTTREITGIFADVRLMDPGNLPPEYRCSAQLCEELSMLASRLKQGLRV